MSLPILPGAEPWTHDGGPAGALCIHGFTGSPSSMRGIAEAYAAAGFTVELPRLPGHGTTVEDMITTGWDDWSGAVLAAYERLAARCERVVAAGLSMGGALALWLAQERAELAGVVAVNPATQQQAPEVIELLKGMIVGGEDRMPGIGSDIAMPDVVEVAYPGTPLAPLLELMRGLSLIEGHYGERRQPLLLLSSREDHVVAPEQGDVLAGAWGGPLHRVRLERSYHVATMDFDAELIEAEAVAFGRRVCGVTAG